LVTVTVWIDLSAGYLSHGRRDDVDRVPILALEANAQRRSDRERHL
jgi:hypothetical protein